LWLTDRATTRACVYARGSFAILSLRFLLTSAMGADFVVQIAPECENSVSGHAILLTKMLT